MSVAVQPHLSAVDALRYGPRVFAGPADEPRARRASDAIALAVALFALALISFAASPAPGFARAVAAVLDAIPSFLDSGWQLLADLLVLLGVVLVVAAIVRRRWSIARDVLVAILVATAVWLLVARIVEGSWLPGMPSGPPRRRRGIRRPGSPCSAPPC
jgi:hypothetical protein